MGYGFGRVNDLAHKIHRNAREKGFWDDEPGETVRGRLSLLMLIGTEVAEAAEAVRKDDPENFEEELADIIIRTLDVAEGCGIQLEQAIVNKMEANAQRPRKHGKLA